VEDQTRVPMVGAQGVHRIIRHCRRAGHFRQVLAVRSSESERAVGQSLDLLALFVNSAMVPATEQGEVRERRRSAL